MSWNSVLADFSTLLNRDDCSAAQAAIFMQQGVQRIQRDCRLPSMERQTIYTVTGTNVNNVLVPQDLIEPIDLIWTPGPNAMSSTPRALKKAPAYRDMLAKFTTIVEPEWYSRLQTQYWIAGAMQNGDQLQVIYYGNFSSWVNGNADNELSASTPDLMIYAALTYGGDYFECDQTAGWEAKYQALKGSVNQMAEDIDAYGGEQAMENVYRWECE